MATLYWRHKKNGKWTWTRVQPHELFDLVRTETMNECDDDCDICYGYLTDGSGDEFGVDDAAVPLGGEEE